MKDYFDSIESKNGLAIYETSVSASVSPTSRPVPAPIPMPSTPDVAIISLAAELVETSLKCFTEYQMCKAHEETERKRIAAELKIVLGRIEATKELYKDIIERSFNEREGLYKKALKAVDLALEISDIDMLKVSYNFILGVYEKAPNININLG